MKLDYLTNDYTIYKCTNDKIIYKETYTNHHCNSSSSISYLTSNEYYDYNCDGNVKSCNYVKLLSYDTCSPSNYNINNDENYNHMIIYELTNDIYQTSNNTNYLSTCSDNEYIKNTNISINGTARRRLSTMNTSSSSMTDIIHPYCIDNQRIFVDECYTPWTANTDCGFVFDYNSGYGIPLETCNSNYGYFGDESSFKYYCQNNQVFKCEYDNTDCNGDCISTQYTEYDLLLNCNTNALCPMVQYDIYANCQTKSQTKSVVVDTCIANQRLNISLMWKCKQHSIAKHIFYGTDCDENSKIEGYAQVIEETCQRIDNEYFSTEIIDCTSPKCKKNENTADSYAICKIFDDTNVDQVMPFWDTYFDDYCDWFGDDVVFGLLAYKCNDDAYGITLSLSDSAVSGTLNTSYYSWPSDLHRLNLNDLGLNGKWNWWSLKSEKLEYIDISNNNFTGNLELFPFLYSNTLHTLNIANNLLMTGYIDWTFMGYLLQRNLYAFLATDIKWSGYADFSSLPDDSKMYIELDVDYQCDPYKYICKQGSTTTNRSNIACNDKSTCQQTCKCSDGSVANSTQFPGTPVLGTISCGETIASKYQFEDISTKNIWGDNGHFYLIDIPDDYGDDEYINVTFDAISNFNGILIIHSADDSDNNKYERIYDDKNPWIITAALKAANYYYLQIITIESHNNLSCVDNYNDTDKDEYWHWFKKGYYQSGYQCDFDSYKYSIFMDGCTAQPTMSPTKNPLLVSIDTTMSPTTDISDVNGNQVVIFDLTSFPDEGITVNDAYGRIEIMIESFIKRSELQLDDTCLDCFEWFFQNINWSEDGIPDDRFLSLNKYYGYDGERVTFYNKKTGSVIINGIVYNVFQSHLIISSVRTKNAGYCPDTDKTVVFHPGSNYRIKLRVNNDNDMEFISDTVALSAQSHPYGGKCQVFPMGNDDDSHLFSEYVLNCSDWESDGQELKYNFLYGNIPSSNQFMNDSVSIKIGGSDNVTITALIQDEFAHISCYDVIVSMRSINEIDIDGLTGEISTMIHSDEMIRDIDVISIFMTMDAVFECMDGSNLCFEPSIYKIYRNLADQLFSSLLASSVVLSKFDGYNATLWDKLHEISVFAAATINYISFDALEILCYKYTSAMLDSVKSYLSGDTESYVDLFAMAIELHTMIQNLDIYLSGLSIDVADINDLAYGLIQSTLDTTHLALLDSYPGEIFNHSFVYQPKYSEKLLIGKKFEITKDDLNKTIKCGFDNDYIMVPNAIFDTDETIFDCSFFITNHEWIEYETNNDDKLISVNLYQGDENLPINFYQEATNCHPYLITFKNDQIKVNNDYILDEENVFPACILWNNTAQDWNHNKCFVYDMNEMDETVTCGCNYLRTHRITSDEFTPIANVEPVWIWRKITADNVNKYPIVLITIIVILVLILFMGAGGKYVEKTVNRPILAYEDVIFIKNRDERMKNDIVGKEIAYIEKYLPNQGLIGHGISKLIDAPKAKKSLCMLHTKLLAVYLLNHHILFSIFVHPSGSNISIRFRIGLFLLYLCTVMAITAMHFGLGREQSSSDVGLSFWVSIIAVIPVICLQLLFRKSKPKVIPKSVNLVEDMELKKVTSWNEEFDDESILDYLRDTNIDKKAKYEASILNERYSLSLNRLKSNSVHERMSTLDVALEELRKTNSSVHRLQLVDDVRKTLFDTLYPLPHYYKTIAWVLMIILILSASIIAILYSLQFGVTYSAKTNPLSNDVEQYEQDCWENNQKLWIQSELSYSIIDDLNSKITRKSENNYSGNESIRWLTSCIVSIILFILIFQPLWVYITTWLKIWMFTWNLSMNVNFTNLYQLCNRCCLHKYDPTRIRVNTNTVTSLQLQNQVGHASPISPRRDSNIESKISDLSGFPTTPGFPETKRPSTSHSNTSQRRGSQSYCTVVHPDRPLDLLGYLCNDDLFLTIDDKSGKLLGMMDMDEMPTLQEMTSKDCTTTTREHFLPTINEQKWEESQDEPDNPAGRRRRPTISYTNPNEVSITATEMTEVTMTGGDFDSRELAMMRIAAGNIFDYKTDIIKEEEEHEHTHDPEDSLFPYVNSDGIEETDDEEDDDEEDDDEEDVAISQISRTGINIDDKLLYKSSADGSSETSANCLSDNDNNNGNYNGNEEEYESEETMSEIHTEEDTPDEYYENETKNQFGDRPDSELIEAITVALSDERNHDIAAGRRSTESMINNAALIMNPVYRETSDNDGLQEDEEEEEEEDEDTMICIDDQDDEEYDDYDDRDESSRTSTNEYIKKIKNPFNVLTMFTDNTDDNNNNNNNNNNTKHGYRKEKKLLTEFAE